MDAVERERLLAEAESRLTVGRAKEALELLNPYLVRYPADAKANALAGVAWAQEGLLLNAERHLKLSVAVDDSQFEMKRMLLRILIDLAKWDEAFPLAEELRRDDPNDRVLQVMLESARENLKVPDAGWTNSPRLYNFDPGSGLEEGR